MTATAESLGLDVAAIDDRLARRRNLPVSCYVEDAIHEFELDAIFTNAWQYFAPVHKLQRAGSTVTGMVGRTPIVVVRSDDGELRGFVNACRHRGYQVVTNDGQCSVLQCRYHGWVYGLDGSLRRTGAASQDTTIEPETTGLHPVSVDVYGQGVFVNPTPDAGSLADAFPELAGVGESIGIDQDLDRYTPHSTYAVHQRSNWKLWYDNGTECYHCPLVHKDSFGAAYDTRDGVYEFREHGNFSSSYFEPSARPGEMVGGGYRSVQLFPGTQFIQQNDLMVMGRVIPTGPRSCWFLADYLAERGSDPAKVDEWVKLWSQTYDEDGDVVATIQKNLASGRVDELIYIDGIEDVSRFFHGLIWAAYKRHLD